MIRSTGILCLQQWFGDVPVFQIHAIYSLGCGYESDSWLMGHVICFLSLLYPLPATSKSSGKASFKRVLLWQFGIASGNITLLLVVKTDYSVIQPHRIIEPVPFWHFMGICKQIWAQCCQEHTQWYRANRLNHCWLIVDDGIILYPPNSIITCDSYQIVSCHYTNLQHYITWHDLSPDKLTHKLK